MHPLEFRLSMETKHENQYHLQLFREIMELGSELRPEIDEDEWIAMIDAGGHIPMGDCDGLPENPINERIRITFGDLAFILQIADDEWTRNLYVQNCKKEGLKPWRVNFDHDLYQQALETIVRHTARFRGQESEWDRKIREEREAREEDARERLRELAEARKNESLEERKARKAVAEAKETEGARAASVLAKSLKGSGRKTRRK